MSDMEDLGLTDDIADLFNLNETPDVPKTNSAGEGESEEDTTPSYPVAPKPDAKPPTITREKRLEDSHTDYQFARKTLHHSIEKGSEALTELVYFASNSGGPEAFKQVASVMDAITRSSKQLLDIQNQMNTSTQGGGAKGTTAKQQAQTINNNTTIVESDGGTSKYAGMTREEAIAARRKERQERAEKQVN